MSRLLLCRTSKLSFPSEPSRTTTGILQLVDKRPIPTQPSRLRKERCCCRLSSSSSADIVKGPSLLRTSVHRPTPSLLYLPALRSLPFWTQYKDENTRVAYQEPTLTFAVEHFEKHWETILEEYQSVAPTLASDYQVDTEHSLHEGTWDWHSFMKKGQRLAPFQQKFPKTWDILRGVNGLLFEDVPFGYTFFSTLHPHSRIAPHSSPMNFRVRMHLPLLVPNTLSHKTTTPPPPQQQQQQSANVPYPCGIRVGPLYRDWIPGRALLLDDSYNHEVWNNTSQTRVVLLVDFWHPDVTPQERRDIVAMFDHAKQQGWWSTT